MTPALFGILQLDRGEPLGYANVPGLVQAWLQDAGGFAAVGLLFYLLYTLSVPTDKSQSERLRVPVSTWMLAMGALAAICYLGVFALLWFNKGAPPEPPPPPPGVPVKTEPPVWHGYGTLRPFLLMVAGLFALLAIGEPFARDLVKVRARRVWALARLGFKEAVRSRLQWVGLLVLVPFLFRNVWMANTRPADEFRSLVEVATLSITLLVLFTGVILSSFSIPTDIKNQTIHTVVTKPVERFEVVLGRFLGYVGMLTLALAGMTVVSLLLIGTAVIDPKAKDESAKARVPVRGKLEFKSRRADFEGTNVGREFEYRKYIAGDPDSPQRAIWEFPTVPAGMTHPADDWVPVEFTFDIFKLTKGEENKGVLTTFRFVTHHCPQVAPRPDQRGEWQWADLPGEGRGGGEQRKHKYEDDLAKLPRGAAAARPGSPGWGAVSKLAEDHGFYEIRGKEVFDYAVMGVEVPAGLFRNAAAGDPGTEPGPDGKPRPRPRVSVYVKCESKGQLLGMAEPDLYLLEANQPFAVNFVKGAVGLWCRLCIVIGLAIACSTYLSGVLSLLVAVVIFLLGYATDHLNDLAFSRNVGGGPFEAMSRLVRADTPTAELGDSAGVRALLVADKGWAWVVRRIQNVIPDVESFTWTHFVSEGFNVNVEYLVVNVLVTVGYLLPWAVLAYYLMKSREVAA